MQQRQECEPGNAKQKYFPKIEAFTQYSKKQYSKTILI